MNLMQTANAVFLGSFLRGLVLSYNVDFVLYISSLSSSLFIGNLFWFNQESSRSLFLFYFGLMLFYFNRSTIMCGKRGMTGKWVRIYRLQAA